MAVRIVSVAVSYTHLLNGAHTSFVPAAFLCGYDYVLDAMNDPMILTFMQKTLYDEVIPCLLYTATPPSWRTGISSG